MGNTRDAGSLAGVSGRQATLSAPLAAACCWFSVCLATANSPAAEGEQAACIGVLRSDSPPAEKVLACKRLAVIGGAESVEPLAALLADEQLGDAARRALESIPGDEAAHSLRVAAGELRGRTRWGAIQSLGARGDQRAVPLLTSIAEEGEPEAAAAAIVALGAIATPEAASALAGMLPKLPEKSRAIAGSACLAAAEQLAARGRADQAGKIYAALLETPCPEPVRCGALRGAILARTPIDMERFCQLASSQVDKEFSLALTIGREVASPHSLPRLAELLADLPPAHQVLWVELLADVGDASTRAVVLPLVRSDQPEVRRAAVRAMARLGQPGDLELLIAAANDPALADVSMVSLCALPGEGVDQRILVALKAASDSVRPLLLDVAGRRRIAAAVPSLLAAAGDPDPAIRLIAFRGLGGTASAAELPWLAERVLKPASDEEAVAARESLTCSALRLADKDESVRSLAAAMDRAEPAAKAFFLEVLGLVGGGAALERVAASVADPDASVRDAATRVLGVWPTADVEPVLELLARTLEEEKLRTRALRGYLRVARQLDVAEDRRLAICTTALSLAERDEERRVAVETLGRLRSVSALEAVVSHLASPAIGPAAATAAVSIAEKLPASDREAACQAMHSVLAGAPHADVARRARDVLERDGD